MLIEPFPSGPFETNAYVVACERTHVAAIIDPAPGSADAIMAFLQEKKLTPKLILLTHSHWDHIADASRFQLPIWVHEADAPNVRLPGSDGLPLFFSIKGVEPTSFLQEGQVIELGDLRLKVLHTPGHSPGGVCFYEEARGVLLSGDTLFKGTIGNLSFPTSNPEAMWTSLDKLARLPPKTRVFPGHGPVTSVGAESWLSRARELFSE